MEPIILNEINKIDQELELIYVLISQETNITILTVHIKKIVELEMKKKYLNLLIN